MFKREYYKRLWIEDDATVGMNDHYSISDFFLKELSLDWSRVKKDSTTEEVGDRVIQYLENGLICLFSPDGNEVLDWASEKSYFYHENSDTIFIEKRTEDFGVETDYIHELFPAINESYEEFESLLKNSTFKHLKQIDLSLNFLETLKNPIPFNYNVDMFQTIDDFHKAKCRQLELLSRHLNGIFQNDIVITEDDISNWEGEFIRLIDFVEELGGDITVLYEKASSCFDYARRKADNQRPIRNIETNKLTYIHLPEASFGGVTTPDIQVVKSAAGFYIGTLLFDKQTNSWLPDSRLSSYYQERVQAEKDLITGKYTR